MKIDREVVMWLDCDPGHDDAMAIILAAHTPGVKLLGVSTTCGNQTLDKTTDNALRILHLIGRDDVAVYKGAAKPLTRPRRNCPEIHGASGLDGPDIQPAPREAINADDEVNGDEKAVNAMARVIRQHASEKARLRAMRMREVRLCPASGDQEIKEDSQSYQDSLRAAIDAARDNGEPDKLTVVATGALTNIALFASLYPELLEHTEVVIMGGAMGQGNTNPVAEFNIQCDPEAAHIVFECGVKLAMVPLEVTHTALVTPTVRARLLDDGSRFRRLVDELMQFFAQTYKDVFAFEHPPLHDPCAVAYALRPDLFTVKSLRVDVETTSSISAGQTVCDIWRQSGKEPNAEVCVAMNVEKFWEMMCDAVDKADAACPAALAAAGGEESGGGRGSKRRR